MLYKKRIILGFCLFAVLLMPFLNLLRSEAFWRRPKFTIISGDLGVGLRINEERGEDIKNSFLVPSLFHNKIIAYGLTFADNYMKHFSFPFLFLSGDPIKIYQTVGNGLIYIVFFPFLIYGLYHLISSNLEYKWLIFSWLVISPIPAALTRFVPSASRIFTLAPVISMLSAVGIYGILNLFRKVNPKKVFVAVISICFIFNMAYYLHYYYFNTNYRYAKEWHYGEKELINNVSKIQDKYNRVWFSKNVWGYIYPLFYLAYPADKYQKQARLSELNQYGFGWVKGFEKYVFDDIGDVAKLSADTLYIGDPSDFPKIKKPILTIYYPDGNIAFYLANRGSF